MKPKLPFMIECGNDFVKFTKSGKVKIVDWEGTQFATADGAQAMLDNHRNELPENAKVIEIIDCVRVTVRS